MGSTRSRRIENTATDRAQQDAQRDSIERLRRSELRYRTLFDSVDQGTCVCEMVVDETGAPIDYRFLEVNPAFGAMTGLVGDVVGRTACELVPGLESHWVTTYARAGLGRESVRFEAGAASMGREFSVFAAPIEPRGCFVLLFTDVTERKAAERREQRAAALDAYRLALLRRLRPLSDAIDMQHAACEVLCEHLTAHRVAYFEVRGEHYIVERDVARGVASMVGRYPVEAFSSALLETYRAGLTASSEDVRADADLGTEQHAAFAAAGIQAYVGVPLVKGDELVAGLAVHWARPRPIEPDELLAIEETAELTWSAVERARSDAALRQRVDELVTILRVVPVGVWIARDPACRHVTGNDHSHALMRTQGRGNVSMIDASEHMGFRCVRDGVEIARADLPMQRCARLGEPVPPEEMELQFDDGSRRTLLCNAVPLKDAQGAVMGVIGVGIDLSERKAIERTLHEADQRKDEFLAVLAHELRNPLAPIRNAIALLGMSEQAPPAPPLLAMLERQVGHMVRLVDDLMEVSRIQRGTIDLQRERLNLTRVIHSAVETSRPAIDTAGHALQLELGDEPLHVEGDAVRLAQVFANLLNNAARYTDPGGRIALKLGREGPNAVVEVSDSGIGIAPEQIDRMFTMFGQVDPTAWRSKGGMGIGLTLAQRIAGLHGGGITAHSGGLGHGSRFTVQLPLARQPGDARRASAPEGTHRLALRRVLVVDDNRDAADSLGQVLAARGADVRVAHDASEALALLAHWPAQALVLDLGMPGIDGHELARRVRAQPLHRQSVLIAVSGWGQERDRRLSKANGFDHHLTKPVDTGALEALIATMPVDTPATMAGRPARQEMPDVEH